MTFDVLKDMVMLASKSRPSYIRLGQFVFNYIDETYGVARHVQFVDKVDCFYDDSKIDAFLECCLVHINKYEKIINEKC